MFVVYDIFAISLKLLLLHIHNADKMTARKSADGLRSNMQRGSVSRNLACRIRHRFCLTAEVSTGDPRRNAIPTSAIGGCLSP